MPTSSASSYPGGYYTESGPNIGAIVGGAIGAVVAACLLGFLFYLWRRERAARRRADAATAASVQKSEGKSGLDDDGPESSENMSTAARYPYGMSPYAPYGPVAYDPYAYRYNPGYGYHPASAAATWDAPSSHDYAQSQYYAPPPPPPPPRSADSSDFPLDYSSNSGGLQVPPSLSPSSSGYAAAAHRSPHGGGGATTSVDDSAYHSSTAQSYRYPYHVQGSGSDSRSYAIPEI